MIAIICYNITCGVFVVTAISTAVFTTTQKSISIVENLLDLVSIFDKKIQISCLSRPINKEIGYYFAQLAEQNKLMTLRFQCVYHHQKAIDWGFLPDLVGKNRLIEDIELLLDIYTELLGCQRVGFRLEVLDKAMCPRFHVDKVGVRLLCTYQGVGTQWLDDSQANRAKLGLGAQGLADECSGLMVVNEEFGQANPFDIVLLKGASWPENEGKGAIHRSPRVDCAIQPRVLLVLDAIWN